MDCPRHLTELQHIETTTESQHFLKLQSKPKIPQNQSHQFSFSLLLFLFREDFIYMYQIHPSENLDIVLALQLTMRHQSSHLNSVTLSDIIYK